MKAYDLFELAKRNLRESLLRNSLTTIGIAVGVASLVAMLSLGIGLQQLASRQLGKTGLFDSVIVTSRRDFGHSRDSNDKSGVPADQARILDERARQEMGKIPGVVEAFPDVRFITDLDYETKPHLTMVAGLPFSAKSNDAFEGMQGTFFSSDAASEAILQKSFAEKLLGLNEVTGSKSPNIADIAKQLLGKELTMRYAERQNATASRKDNQEASAAGSSDREMDSAAYTVISRKQELKIVGVVDIDPDS